jgi:hypothetical protein
MSSIILTSFHRWLNNKPLDIEEQIAPYKDYWESVSDCEAIAQKISIKNYQKFNVGDPVTILMAVDTAPNERNAVLYECPEPEWKFNPKKDLIINGILTKKVFRDSSNLMFTVQINKLNYPNTTILTDKVQIGEVVDFRLQHLTIK